MKKLLMMLSLISTMSAQTNLVLGLNVSHVNFEDNFRDEYKFCDGIHNNLFGIEQINGKNSYSILSFTNSYFNQSYSVNYNRNVRGNFKVGLSLVYGYNKVDTLYSDDNKYRYDFNNNFYLGNKLSLIPTIGYDFKLTNNSSIEVDLFGEAVITTLKVKL